ncbi:hypothetical protein HMPREF9553_05071, partial [Escherichia coli MS 200-1]
GGGGKKKKKKAALFLERGGGKGSGSNLYAVTCKTHCLTGDNFAAFARFNRTVDFHLAFCYRDFRLRAAFAPAFQFQQVAQLNVRMFT